MGAETAGWMFKKTNVDVGRKFNGMECKIAGVFDGDVKRMDGWMRE